MTGFYEPELMVQFLQHAHRRIDGHLTDFRDALEVGEPDWALLEEAKEELLQHMYAEEVLAFPALQEDLPDAIAQLLDEHGQIWDLMSALDEAVATGADLSYLFQALSALLAALAAHSSEEDFGIYPELLARLGPERTLQLLEEAERLRPPPGWVCSARAGQGRAG